MSHESPRLSFARIRAMKPGCFASGAGAASPAFFDLKLNSDIVGTGRGGGGIVMGLAAKGTARGLLGRHKGEGVPKEEGRVSLPALR